MTNRRDEELECLRGIRDEVVALRETADVILQKIPPLYLKVGTLETGVCDARDEMEDAQPKDDDRGE